MEGSQKIDVKSSLSLIFLHPALLLFDKHLVMLSIFVISNHQKR